MSGKSTVSHERAQTPIGMLPPEWEVKKLGENALIKARIGWRGLSAREYTKDGPLLVAGTHIRGTQIDWKSCDHISEFRYEESPEIQLRDGDVILSKDGTLGRIGIVERLPGKATINGTMMLVRPNHCVFEPKFLYFYLQGRNFRNFINEKVCGSSVPHIFQRDMVSLLAPRPAFWEQRKIGAILASVDDAIDKTQAVIDQVQVVKRESIQELLTRGVSGRHTRFKQTEAGEIPDGWNLVSLAECGATVTSGSRGWAKYYSDNGALFLRITNLARNSIRLQLKDTKRVTLPDGSTEGKRTRVKPGDLVISITADLGLIGVIPKQIEEAYVNQHLALVRLHDHKLSAEFTGHFLTTDVARNRFLRLNDGGAKAGLNLPTIGKLKVPQPSRDEQDFIVQAVSAMEDRLEAEKHKVAELAAVKFALMSVLLTGELRVVRDAEAA